MSNFGDLHQFNGKFGLPVARFDHRGPNDVDPELIELRKKHLREEVQEFHDAADAEDHAEMFDALIDIAYLALGTAQVMGFPWQAGWRAVHSANMTKIRATHADESKRASAWDIVKPHDFVPPDIAGVLRAFGWALDKLGGEDA